MSATADIHLWQAQLDTTSPEELRRLRALLSPDERERASGFRFERDRRRFTVARGILRTLLGDYLGRAPQEIAFTYGEHGKPRLVARGGAPTLHFNVAHAEGLALFAFTYAGEIGVDVERMRPLVEWEQIAQACFGPEEIARLKAARGDEREAEFFRAWARHEAWLKAIGTGLGGRFSGRDASPKRPPTTADHAAASTNFYFHDLTPITGFVGALAAPRCDCRLRSYEWRDETPSSGSAGPEIFL